MRDLSKEEGVLVVYEDHEDWETMEQDIVRQSRWSNLMVGVYHHKPSGEFYEIHWRVGSTESQDERPFAYEEPELTRVYPKEVIVVSYVKEEEL